MHFREKESDFAGRCKLVSWRVAPERPQRRLAWSDYSVSRAGCQNHRVQVQRYTRGCGSQQAVPSCRTFLISVSASNCPIRFTANGANRHTPRNVKHNIDIHPTLNTLSIYQSIQTIWYNSKPSKMNIAVTLFTCITEITCSNLSWDTVYFDVFLVFSVPLSKYRGTTSSMPLRLPFKSFPIHRASVTPCYIV